MANDGFIEFLTPDALAQLKEASAIVDKLVPQIEKISKFKAPTTPSGADSAAKQMIADLKAQEQAIKQATNALIQEERVKQQVLATEIKQSNAIKANIAQREAQRKASLAQQQSDEKAAKAAERSALANQRLNDAYGKLNASRNQAARTLQNLIASETASNAEIRKAQREFDILDGKVKKADKAVGNFSRNVGNYGSALSGVTQLMSAFGIATGLALGADIVKNIFQTTKELQSLDLALKMVSETQDKYGANTSFVRELSEKWGIEIKGLTEQFTQFYVNAKGKLSEDAIRTSFEGIAKAGSLMGISIDKQNDAFYAFNQMLSKGTVQAEELKKQLGNALPGAIKAATMAYQELNPNLKVTEQMMLDQMKAGKLVSTEMVPAIIRAYQKLYGIENVNGVNTLAAAHNRLNNSWTEMIRNMNETSTDGVGKWFDYVLKGLNFLIVEADRFINSWDTINKKAAETGAARGKKSFSEDITKATSRKDEETIIKFTQESTLTAISRAEGELKDVEEYLKELEEWSAKNIAQAALGIGLVKRRNANFRKEDLIEEIAYLKAKANASKTFIKDREDKLKAPKAEVSDKTLTDEEIAALKKAKKEREKLLKEQEQFEEELRKNAYQRKISDLEREKEIIKDLRDLETTSLEDKLFLEDAYAFKQIQINQAVYDEKIRLAKKEYDEKYKLVKGNASQEKKVLKYKNNQEAIALNDLLTANENALSDSLDRQNKLKEDDLKSNLEKTKEWYKKNPPMFLQSDREREEAEKIKAILKDLQNEFRNYIQGFQQSFFNEAGFGQSFDFFIKLDEAGKTAFDRINESNLTTKEKFQANFLAISESAQEMYSFINQMSAENFEAEKQRLEEETNIALAFAGESQTAKDEINRQAEEKRKQIQRREFQAKKQQAIFNIAIDTAQAIMATYGQLGFFGGLAGAAIIAAIGLAQIAAVQAQEIPAYKTGTDNHKGGTMLVNDGSGSNYKETIQTPDGKIYQPKERNVIMNAPKGTKVFTHDQWQRNLDNILMKNEINYSQPNVVVNSGMSDEQVDRIVNTIANKQEAILSIDKNGWNTSVRNGHTQKEILNNQVTFGR